MVAFMVVVISNISSVHGAGIAGPVADAELERALSLSFDENKVLGTSTGTWAVRLNECENGCSDPLTLAEKLGLVHVSTVHFPSTVPEHERSNGGMRAVEEEKEPWELRRVVVEGDEIGEQHWHLWTIGSVGLHEECVEEEDGCEEESLRELEKLMETEPDVEIVRRQRLVPTAMRFYIPSDPNVGDQWQWNGGNSASTEGDASAGSMSMNLYKAWEKGYTGLGTTVVVVDNWVECNNPDLIDNCDDRYSWDASHERELTQPPPLGDLGGHGTSVAGLVAAGGDNGVCGAGAAFDARLIGVQAVDLDMTPAKFARAELTANHFADVVTNSWGPNDDGTQKYRLDPLEEATLVSATTNGRGGLGTVFVWAAGNGYGEGDRGDYDGYVNSPYTVAVGAVTHRGLHATYSEPCACLHVVTPSSGAGTSITTTASTTSGRPNECTSKFGGTSAAAPEAAGGIALVLQARPDLTWRDVQHVLVRSAVKNDPDNAAWIKNGAGFWIHELYGFGMFDVEAAIELAKVWERITPYPRVHTEWMGLDLPIPDGGFGEATANWTYSISRWDNTDAFESDFVLDHLEFEVNITHPSRGELEIYVFAPSGTRSSFAVAASSDRFADLTAHRFTSIRHLDEQVWGDWEFYVEDRRAGTGGGRVEGYKLTFWGRKGGIELRLSMELILGAAVVGALGAGVCWCFTHTGQVAAAGGALFAGGYAHHRLHDVEEEGEVLDDMNPEQSGGSLHDDDDNDDNDDDGDVVIAFQAD